MEFRKRSIEAKLSDLVSAGNIPELLIEGARYTLLAPAKRIRPLLTLAVCEVLGVDFERALVPACAIELVHTYSLIHDDLPCMDDDDFRRGMPTLHKKYSEGHAVLVGDYLLTLAFEVLAKAPNLSAEQRLALITLLTEAAGGEGMVGGQVIDIAETRSISLCEMHAKKTGALFRAALLFGGIVADAPHKTREILRTLGEKIGLLFQIIDDILDEEGTFTFDEAEGLFEEAKEVCASLPGEPTPLIAQMERIINTVRVT